MNKNIYLWTGDGWGKTTSAFGAALRVLGHSYRAIIVQFMKGRKEKIGEYRIQKKLPGLVVKQFGRTGFVNLKKPSAIDRQLPLPGLPSAEFKIALTAEEMIQQAQSQPWDWIVTDLEYGREDVDGGIRVIQALQEVKSVKAIFTGSDDQRRIKELQSLSGMDYLIAPFLVEDNKQFYGKFQILGKVMAEYYSQRL